MHTDRSQRAPSRSRWLLAAALFAAVLVPASAWAHTATKPAPQKPAPTRGKAHPTAGATAVMVHGLWTITVRNSNGTLASRHTFENSFTNPALLASILTGESTVGLWAVVLNGDGCVLFLNVTNDCTLLEAADSVGPSYVGIDYFRTLIVTNAGKDVVLAGSATMTAPAASGITGVQTRLTTCIPQLGPTACDGANTAANGGFFTQCALATTPQPGVPACIRADGSPATAPIAVKPNQQVAVKVVISFT